MNRLVLSACIALAACATAAAPSQAPSAPRDPPVHQRVINRIMTPAPEGDEDLGGARAQALAFVGREDLAWSIARVRDRPVCEPLLRDGRPIDPAEAIVARAADAQFVMLNEDGELILATPGEGGLAVHAKTQLLTKTSWTPPSLAGTVLYARDRKEVIAVDLH